jgi:hypothetical protein
VARALSRSFLKQLKTITAGDLARIEAGGPAFRTRLKSLGFEKRETEILIQMTAGAAAQAANGKNSLKMFVEQVESGARQLAKSNVTLNR